LAVLNPDEQAINYWMGQGLGSFNDVVNQTRAANPMLAKQIDAARAVAQPTPLPLSTQGYNFSAVAANPNAPATISGTAPAGYNYAAAKPTDEIGSQINDIYRNVLNRDVEQEGLNHWMSQYKAGLSMPEIEAQIRQIGRDIGVAAPTRPTTTVSEQDTTYTPAPIPTLPDFAPTTPTLIDPFKPVAPTMSDVKSAYEQGGGSTRMPTITDIKPTDRTYTQNQAYALLDGYLKANPNAAYSDVVAFARRQGIPDMQAKAAFNEFRFNSLTGGSKQAYDYLMGRGTYSAAPFIPGGGKVSRSYAEMMGLPTTFTPKNLKQTTTDTKLPEGVPKDVPVIKNPKTGSNYSSFAAFYFDANPDVREAYETQVKGNMSADDYVKYHYETLAPAAGEKEKRKGYYPSILAAQAADPATGAGGGGATGGLAAALAGGGMSRMRLMGVEGAAKAGGHLGDYSDGGRLLRGPGDGVSDSIPATIGGKRPARLADGEFVVPARIVSELGNGSTEAGARKLYAMMDRIQAARRKSIGKGKVAKNSRADKYLPA
jgi:hypothetical protein